MPTTLVCAAVLSGNRNFEARIHPNIRANFLASPPLVVAYALAGTVQVDLMTEPVGKGKDGKDVYLGDIWPSSDEIHALLRHAMDPEDIQAPLQRPHQGPHALEQDLRRPRGRSTTGRTPPTSQSRPSSTDFEMTPAAVPAVKGARILGLVRRLDHHRPHLAGGLDQGHLARRAST